MQRLTIRNSDGSVSQPIDTTVDDVFQRLADYEDLGFTPDELKAIVASSGKEGSLKKTVRPHRVQMVSDNYDIKVNPVVAEKYPLLHAAVCRHDRICSSSWYDLSDDEYQEYLSYRKDNTIPYMR